MAVEDPNLSQPGLTLNHLLPESNQLPAFSKINPADIEPAIDYLLHENKQLISSLIRKNTHYTWGNTIQIIEDLNDRLNRVWSPVSHLHSVADNKELRAAYNACLPKLSEYATELGQNEDLYRAYRYISEGTEFKQLNQAQKSIIEHALLDFRLSGIELDNSEKHQFKQTLKKLSQLQTRFEENLLDATHAWKKHITNPEQLNGLPDSAISLAAQTAQQEGKDGWLFTLEFPSYMPVMKYADNEGLDRILSAIEGYGKNVDKDRYAASPYLKNLVSSKKKFYEA